VVELAEVRADLLDVGRLELAWTYMFNRPDRPRISGPSSFELYQQITPIVVDGVMYVSTAWSKVKALDAANGALLWEYDPKAEFRWTRLGPRYDLPKVLDAEEAARRGLAFEGWRPFPSRSLYFGGVHAVEDVSFDVEPGEVFAIIGPNGAGKSTIFNLVSRLYEPTNGSISYGEKDLLALRDTTEEDPRELEASKFDLNYISLDGTIGCMVNGAGLAMATMDIIKLHGAEPANFLDVGGGANAEQVTNAFRLILSDPKVEAVLVNIFGGIMRCDTIAEGVVAAAREIDMSVPLVVRLEGTNVEQGRKILEESGLALDTAASLDEAAEKIVARVGGAS